MKPQTAMSIFRSPFNTWSAEEILTHYQTRNSVQYFAVADPAQTTRAVIDRVLNNEFIFHEEAHQLPAKFAWTTNPSRDVEWLIMWHKFYYAVGLGQAYDATKDARYTQQWMALTESWIDSVPLDFLPADVTGRRLQNWIFAHYYFVTLPSASALTPTFYAKFLQSIYAQVCHLLTNLTEARNHRTLELYAIFLVAVVFPEMKGASAWLEFAKTELLKNMQADLLSDGVQCELSTDYHHIVLRNYLSVRKLAALNKIPMPDEMDTLIKKALEFSLYVHKPDGFIPSLSDGDTGNYLDLLAQGYELYGHEEMLFVATQGQQGKAPAHKAKAFAASGYYILRSGWGEKEAYEDERYLVFDCGPLGAGNHGHLDCLHFEMAAFGQSLIVDPGRYTYDESGDTNWRVLFRGTSAHNTVLVDGKNQTRYEFHKRKFKIKGDAPAHELKEFMSGENFAYLHGSTRSHEYPVTHERKIFFVSGDYWILTDLLRADETHAYDQLFHLSASAAGHTTLHRKKNSVEVNAPHLLIAHIAEAPVTTKIESGFVSATYGVKQSAPVVKFSHEAANACFHAVLFPYQQEKPILKIKKIPVYTKDKICAATIASALKITVKQGHDEYTDYYCQAHEAGTYRFGNITWRGQFLFFRRNAQGQILSEYTHA